MHRNAILKTIAWSMLVFQSSFLSAQNLNPVKWQFSGVRTNATEASLIFVASLDRGWHIYSQFLSGDGPMPTSFIFSESHKYIILGKVKEESTPHVFYDPVFMTDIVWFNDVASFTQKIKITDNASATPIQGRVEYMLCNDQMCLPPVDAPFSIVIPAKTKSKRNNGP